MKTVDIVEQINNAITAKSVKVECSIKGLAQPVYVVDSDTEKEFPAVTANGEDIYPFLDDDFAFGIYHKLNGKTYTADFKLGVGSNPKTMEVKDMSVICWGFSKYLTAEGLEQMIISVMPKTVQVLKTDFDRKRVYNAEFSNVPFSIGEDAFLFRMNYTVKTEYKPDCIELEEIFN